MTISKFQRYTQSSEKIKWLDRVTTNENKQSKNDRNIDI